MSSRPAKSKRGGAGLTSARSADRRPSRLCPCPPRALILPLVPARILSPPTPRRGLPAVTRFFLLLLLCSSMLLVRAEAQKSDNVSYPAGQLRALKDFKAELLYPVPAEK